MLIQSRRNVIHCRRTEKARAVIFMFCFSTYGYEQPYRSFDPYATVDLRNIESKPVCGPFCCDRFCRVLD